uniref:Uncharacterized protein n=1 Tax=Chromera velia CCMP2878 TaxID=1169474 RepID=A0A0K6SB63_9ALVE|eukprot:Cvel_13194.t1-p1 / transcript=Cvel_13194.t1 / gene=Cvel_13194 / organism=Chromera_velia_CCMP2878 / gene_product=hypothetical protein / transcript_product=hypothetical protein / location=Cvel_scaffold892:8384-11772(+) / protein_length=113 / sequence_SO=supercontig / SO=protein_coding / is_pseudo=false
MQNTTVLFEGSRFFFWFLQGSASLGEGWEKSGACSNASFSFYVEQGHPGSMPLREVSHLIGAIYIPLFGQYLHIVLKEKPFVGFQVLIHSVQALILPLQVLDFFWCTAWNYTQ